MVTIAIVPASSDPIYMEYAYMLGNWLRDGFGDECILHLGVPEAVSLEMTNLLDDPLWDRASTYFWRSVSLQEYVEIYGRKPDNRVWPTSLVEKITFPCDRAFDYRDADLIIIAGAVVPGYLPEDLKYVMMLHEFYHPASIKQSHLKNILFRNIQSSKAVLFAGNIPAQSWMSMVPKSSTLWSAIQLRARKFNHRFRPEEINSQYFHTNSAMQQLLLMNNTTMKNFVRYNSFNEIELKNKKNINYSKQVKNVKTIEDIGLLISRSKHFVSGPIFDPAHPLVALAKFTETNMTIIWSEKFGTVPFQATGVRWIYINGAILSEIVATKKNNLPTLNPLLSNEYSNDPFAVIQRVLADRRV